MSESADLSLRRERENLRRQLLRERRLTHYWRAAVVGVLAGVMAVLFQYALTGAEVIRVFLADSFQSIGSLGLPITIVFCATLAGWSSWMTSKYAPEAAGSGIPHTMAVLKSLRPLRWLQVLLVKFVGGFLAIGAGLSLGREGPTVHMGACMGKAVGERLGIPKRSYRPLIASGAGAGLAAAFNAPLAGFLFVLELQREFTAVTYGAALIASASADAVTRLVIGQRPAFRITKYPAPSMTLLPYIMLLGVVAGLLGVTFNRTLVATVQRAQFWNWQKGIVVGVVAAFAVWYLPEITGGGHHTAEIVLAGQHEKATALGFLIFLLMAKYLFTLISFGAGVPGGIFAPLLMMGAILGLISGQLLRLGFPNSPINSAAFAVLGMAALFAATVRKPLTGIVLIVEMTSNFEQLYALIVVSLSAYLVAEALRDRPIYDALMENDLHRPQPTDPSNAEPVLLELYVEPGSPLADRQVEDIPLPPGALIVSVLRGRNEFDPPAKFHIRAGDVVVFITEANDPRVSHALHELARE